jgi:tetratricopeptide (TPR) repeat protein
MSVDEIKRRFEFSTDFNEIFDAFESALAQDLRDLDLYRLLFMNPSLTVDELCLFGEKLAAEIPEIAYETYLWLARIFEATHSMLDNFELTLKYYRKAASVRPDIIDTYLRAADCYEPDLNIPPISILIDFLKSGAEQVNPPRELHERLLYFYEILGNDEMREFYRRKLDGSRQDPAPEGP